MGRKTKRIKGPIATDPASWPPIRRRNSEDQKTLERLLSEELDAHWKAIVREDGVAEEEHAELKARDRLRALDRAKYGDTKFHRPGRQTSRRSVCKVRAARGAAETPKAAQGPLARGAG
jgi:hypothetical protein